MKVNNKHLPPKRNPILDVKPALVSLGRVLSVLKSRRFKISISAYIKRILASNLTFLVFASGSAGFMPPANPQEITSQPIEVPLVLKTTISYQYPVREISITTYFKSGHPGIDLDGLTGDPIKPIMPGKVEKIEISRYGYGKSILISHSAGYKSLYAHLSKINVKVGQDVNTDTVIGEMGATGHATGDHLHLEIYLNGKAVNPLSLLKPQRN